MPKKKNSAAQKLQRQQLLQRAHKQQRGGQAEGDEEECSCPHASQAAVTHVERLLTSPAAVPTCQVCAKGARVGGNKKAPKGGAKKAGRGTAEVWLCLRCGLVSCGRYDEAHALDHFETTHHPLALSLAHLNVWCYECDQEVPITASAAIKECVRAARRALLGEADKESDDEDNDKEDAATSTLPNDTEAWLVKDKKRNRGLVEETNAAIDSAGTGLKGLRNLGNTCFFNSIMQARTHLLACLTHTTALREYFSTGRVPPQLTPRMRAARQSETEGAEGSGTMPIVEAIALHASPNEGPLTHALRGFMGAMWAPKGACVNPQTLFSAIAHKAVQFRSYRQQDAQELLRYLLDGVRTEEIARLVPPPSSKTKAEQKPTPKASPPSTFIDDLFGGVLESTVTCHDCHSVSKTREPFLDLSVPLPAECYPEKRRGKGGSRNHTSTATVIQAMSGGVAYQKRKNEPKPLSSKQLKQKAKFERAKKRREEKVLQAKALREGASSTATSGTDGSSDDPSAALPDAPSSNEALPTESSSASQLDESPVQTETLDHGAHGEAADTPQPAQQQQSDNEKTTKDEGTVEQEGNVASATPPANSESTEESDERGSGLASERDPPEAPATNQCDASAPPAPTVDQTQSNALAEAGAPTEGEEKTPKWDGRDAAAVERWITPEVLREVTLYRCLYDFTQPELLEGADGYRCIECTRRRRESSAARSHQSSGESDDEEAEQPTDDDSDRAKKKDKDEKMVISRATKQLLIHRPPPILTIHVKRFRQSAHGLSKAGEHVKFPLVLSLAPFVVPHPEGKQEEQKDDRRDDDNGGEEEEEEGGRQREQQQQHVYRLYGLSVHQGGIGGGHYTARLYAHTQGRWYSYSDSHGHEVSLPEVLGSEAYVLFYERVLSK